MVTIGSDGCMSPRGAIRSSDFKRALTGALFLSPRQSIRALQAEGRVSVTACVRCRTRLSVVDAASLTVFDTVHVTLLILFILDGVSIAHYRCIGHVVL